MMVTIELGLENDQEGNTWWSNGHPDENSIQVHVDRPVYVALGKPDKIMVTLAASNDMRKLC
jgi:hypothetical protein